MLNRTNTPVRKLAFGLAVLAMLLQVSIVMQYGQGQSISQSRDAQTGLLTMVICSPTGLKQITVDSSGTIVDEQTPSNNTIDCSFSAALASNNLLSPLQSAILVAPRDSASPHLFSATAKRLTALSMLASPGRGPPA